jgi:hypothetical protein
MLWSEKGVPHDLARHHQGFSEPNHLANQITCLIDKHVGDHTLTSEEYLFLHDHISLSELPFASLRYHLESAVDTPKDVLLTLVFDLVVAI